MKENDIIKTAVVVGIGFMVVPVVIGTAINLVGLTAQGIYNGVEKVKFNKKIKKGLKDGSICEIDGNYYEVKIEEA